MASYNPAIPQSTDLLNVSQVDILNNFSSANTSFGIDHYAFDNGSANNGKHNTVTTPIIVGSAHPATTTDCKFYGMQDSANVGLIQYSRGPNSAAPSPLTKFQSTVAAIVLANNATTNVLDFTGLTRAFAMLYAMDTTDATNLGNTRMVASVFWSGAVLVIDNGVTQAPFLRAQVSGTTLRVLNNNSGVTFNNVYWTLDFERLN